MKFCAKCGRKNEEGAARCGQCGTRFPRAQSRLELYLRRVLSADRLGTFCSWFTLCLSFLSLGLALVGCWLWSMAVFDRDGLACFGLFALSPWLVIVSATIVAVPSGILYRRHRRPRDLLAFRLSSVSCLATLVEAVSLWAMVARGVRFTPVW